MKKLCKVHHFIAQFDANSRVICVKMQCMMNGITWQLILENEEKSKLV